MTIIGITVMIMMDIPVKMIIDTTMQLTMKIPVKTIIHINMTRITFSEDGFY